MASDNSPRTVHGSPVPSEYVIDTRLGIEGLLAAIVRAGSTAYIISRALTTRTSVRLLEIDGRADRLVFVPLSALPSGAELAGAENVLFTTDHEGVPIEFTCQHPAHVRAADRDTYVVRLPTYIVRLQRRDAYRLPAPAIVCTLEPESTPVPTATPQVIDVSAGGLDLELPASEPPLSRDVLYSCSMFLPALGNVWVHLKIVSMLETPGGQRYGCQFVDLSAPSELLLQRYILEEQRARRRARDADVPKPPP